jgi:hypothetical protein
LSKDAYTKNTKSSLPTFNMYARADVGVARTLK